jgi:hypothetical protein
MKAGPGRPKGSLNKATAEVRALAQVYTALQNAFRQTTLDQAMHAYALADLGERRVLWPDLSRKWQHLFPQVPGSQRATVAAQFQKVAPLPVAPASP